MAVIYACHLIGGSQLVTLRDGSNPSLPVVNLDGISSYLYRDW